MSLPVVAIVGRPNVGKSTLFNRLIGFQKAVVHDRPGVTRDRLYEEAEILGHRALVIDTGGLEPVPDTDLLSAMRVQSLVAVEEADVILFLVDGRSGFTPADADVATLLRRSDKPVILVVNKIDGPRHEELGADFYAVGIEPLMTISAAHGRGVYELDEAIVERLPEASNDAWEDGDVDVEDEDEGGDHPFSGPIRIAVVGRPNIGKSTLINQLLGEERHLVHDSPGTTMDPVDSPLTVGDRDYVLVDTAGVRRRAKIDDKLERWVSLRSIRSIERCHVTLLMIDGTVGPTDQDAKIAALVIGRGRGLIVLVNKWDLTKDLEDIDAEGTIDALENRLPHAPWAPHMFISAKTGKGIHRIFATVESVFAQFNQRVGTPALNRFLERVVLSHSPPQKHHHPVRLYYMSQTRVRPPTFAVVSNTPDGIGPAYRRYMARRLREEYGFEGTPLRLNFKRRRKIGEAHEDSSGGKSRRTRGKLPNGR
jgi:GTPase